MNHQLRTLRQISEELDIEEARLVQQVDIDEIIANPIPTRDGKPRIRFHRDATANRIARLAIREQLGGEQEVHRG